MKDHFDKIEWLLAHFDFEELKESDKNAAIKALGSQETYTFSRKNILLAKSSQQHISARPLMKNELLGKFKEKHDVGKYSTKQTFFTRRIPTYYMAAAIVLLLIPIIFLFSKEPIVQQQIVYQSLPAVSDTLYVDLPADTVFIDKVQVVYQKVFVPTPLKEEPVKVITKEVKSDPVIINTSLAGNKVLNDLLVSIQ